MCTDAYFDEWKRGVEGENVEESQPGDFPGDLLGDFRGFGSWT
jgi:hypothetical protein